MKKYAAAFIILAVLAIGSFCIYDYMEDVKAKHNVFATWVTFIPRSGLFQVSLPSSPQYGKDFIVIPGTESKRRYDMYASEQIDGTLFLISVITYPADYDVSLSEDLLIKNIDELMHNKKDNRLVKQELDKSGNHNSLFFIFENQEFEVKGKAIHDDHVVYLLTLTTKKDTSGSEDFDHFIDSFKILKPSKEVVKKVSLLD